MKATGRREVRVFRLVVAAALMGVPLLSVVGEGPTTATAPTTRPTAAPEGARITPEGWFAPPEPGVEKPKLPGAVTVAFVIPIREPITGKTFEAIKRKAVRCRASGAELILFDMDTFGGEVKAALDIARLLKSDLDDIYTACYVRTRAISAGALIALACDEIVMSTTGKLGDCAPLLLGGELKGVQREKIETVLRTEFEESAERNGYSMALAKSMVSYDLEVWLVRNRKTRELRYVLEDEWRGKVDIPHGITSGPSRTDADWELLDVPLRKGKLLTMTPKQAQKYGFASALVRAPRDDELAGVREHFNVAGELKVLEDNWSELLVEFLTSPAVMSFLVFAGILLAYVEMHTPGFGVAGTLAIVCFAIIFGSRFLVGLANWWEIAVFAIGIILIGIEVFVTPGFGVLGISGVLCCVVAMLAMIVPNAPDKLPIPQTDLDWSIFHSGLLALMIGFLAACVGAILLARFLPRAPVAGRLILGAPTVTVPLPTADTAPIRTVRLGAFGIVEGPCRPVGQVRFGEALVDAIADGEFVSAGTRVRAVKIEGNRVVVTPVA